MRALKGLLIYIGIVLGIILGIGLILLCIMYFFPSVRIFGLGIVHYQENFNETLVVFDEYPPYSDIEICISTNKVNVTVIPSDGEDIEYDMTLSVFGVSNNQTKYSVIKNVENDSGIMKVFINVTEPDGLISSSTSGLNLYVPKDEKYNVALSTKSGNITLGHKDFILKLTDITVNSNSGDLTLVNLCSDTENKNLILNSLNLSTGRGLYNLSDIDNLTVNSVIKLNASDGTFRFNNVNGAFDVRGTGVSLYAKNIICNNNGFKFLSNNGYFDIDSLTSPSGAENTIITDNCNVDIKTITGKTGIVTTYGNINIETLNSSTMLQSDNGNVSVRIAKDNITVNTEYGNIKVDDYQKSGKFVSRKGNITVNSTSNYVKGYKTEISNVDGSVTIKNRVNLLLLKTTGRSKVEITFEQIKGGFGSIVDVYQHQIEASENGICTVYMPTRNSTPFKFKAKGTISGDMFSLGGGDGGNRVVSKEEYQYFPNATAEVVEASNYSVSFSFLGKINFKGYTEA